MQELSNQSLEHIVFFMLKPFENNEMDTIQKLIYDISLISGVVYCYFEKNLSDRSKGYNYFLRMGFENEKDLLVYQPHKSHILLKSFLSEYVMDLLILDYYIPKIYKHQPSKPNQQENQLYL
ncbi:hypothetical protein RB653_003765 [Dictyostelium firmibasis]|uniref:Stress-response A/B barrel domain-containing protein n=1 Tax=Dictyostelium firmibasis TaxID=79012 RepID=A0AAN7TZQ5_9MYCE